MSKQTAHLVIGSFIIGTTLAVFGLGVNTLGYWFIFAPTAIWYATKPERSA